MEMVPKAIDLKAKFALFDDYWSPKQIAALNGQVVKVAKLKGTFVWHQHEVEDELFLVVRGRLRMQFRGREVIVDEDEMIVVPAGVEHRPVAEDEVHILLFEPEGTRNTGIVTEERTVETPPQI